MVNSRYFLKGFVLVLAATATIGDLRAETAEENYQLYCAQCHGTLGNGGGINNTYKGLAVSPRDHTKAEEMAKLSDQVLALAIAKGGNAVDKSELMPGFEHTLSENEISELVGHLRKLCACKATE